jgi:hypothetical protein
VVTVNVTAWSTMLHELGERKFDGVDAILIQEHRLEARQFHGAQAAAAKLGWKLDMSPCTQGPMGGPSGGVGVLVRQQYGLRRLRIEAEEVQVPHNARMGFWCTSGGGPSGCLLVPVYLSTGKEDSLENMQLLYQVGGVLRASGKAYIVGADWQMEPGTLHASGWPDSIGGHIKQAGRPTCMSSGREIDFFIVHDRFTDGRATIIDEVATRPHRPVCLRLAGRAPGLMVRVLHKPRAFPIDPIHGAQATVLE